MTGPDRLVLLGTKGGPAIGRGGPNPTAGPLMIGGRACVIDCGLGVSRALVEAGQPLAALDLVFITYLHSDHVPELGPLPHTVAALRTDHPPLSDCFALRFTHDGWSVTFSSDTAHFQPLAGFAAGSDIIAHEAMLEAGVERIVAKAGNGARLREHIMAGHTRAADAGCIAAAAGVRRLVLHHLIPADDPGLGEADWPAALREKWAGPLTVDPDGLEILKEQGR